MKFIIDLLKQLFYFNHLIILKAGTYFLKTKENFNFRLFVKPLQKHKYKKLIEAF